MESRGRYGRPRIVAELRGQGIAVSGKRVGRLMKSHGMTGKKRRSSKVSTTASGTHMVAPNVLNRQFKVSEPNRSWVSDITYFATGEGWLYLAVVIELFSRRVVGWAMDRHIDTTLVMASLEMALQNRPHKGLLLHSDRGSQYACRAYASFLRAKGITASMSRKGDCWDNAVVESFFASIKVELKPERVWKTRAEARTAIFEYIETWYNPRRRHSTNAYLSPIQFEASKCVI